jgi:hypothetical protein
LYRYIKTAIFYYHNNQKYFNTNMIYRWNILKLSVLTFNNDILYILTIILFANVYWLYINMVNIPLSFIANFIGHMLTIICIFKYCKIVVLTIILY